MQYNTILCYVVAVCTNTCSNCLSCDSPGMCSCTQGWKGVDCCEGSIIYMLLLCTSLLNSCTILLQIKTNVMLIMEDVSKIVITRMVIITVAVTRDILSVMTITTAQVWMQASMHAALIIIIHCNCIIIDVDECADGTNGCNQYCTNTYGSYLCYCNAGYELHDNQKSCEGKRINEECYSNL